MTSDNLLNLSQAAKQVGKSHPTIRKWLREGLIAGAVQVTNGRATEWQIPLTELLQAAGQQATSKPQTSTALTVEDLPPEAQLLFNIQQLKSDLKESRALHARAEEELKILRDREAQVWQKQLETIDTQLKRRGLWQRLTSPKPSPVAPSNPSQPTDTP